MKRTALILAAALALSGCTTMGGTPANNGAALTPAETAFAGDWKGRLPSGKPVQIVITPDGKVRYWYMNRSQTLSNVKVTASRLSMTVGSNGSTATMTPGGAYVFTWGPSGEVTRAQLVKG